MKPKNNFLEQLRRRRERAASDATVTGAETEKSIEQMSSEELDLALVRAQQELLDLRHAEMRERELARIQQPTGEGSGQRTLSDVLRQAKQNNRRRRG